MKHFLMELTYTAAIEQIDAAVVEHRAFLQKGFDAGMLLMSGPQNPRTGGVILGRAESLEIIRDFMLQDPFNVKSLATYRFVEFSPVKMQPFMKDWIG
ncbi:MAG: YciI family protein [Spirochaetia bacterium]|nr:YciI family protein [Spirochaetia bacterium]